MMQKRSEIRPQGCAWLNAPAATTPMPHHPPPNGRTNNTILFLWPWTRQLPDSLCAMQGVSCPSIVMLPTLKEQKKSAHIQCISWASRPRPAYFLSSRLQLILVLFQVFSLEAGSSTSLRNNCTPLVAMHSVSSCVKSQCKSWTMEWIDAI